MNLHMISIYLLFILSGCQLKSSDKEIMTLNGKISDEEMGKALIHEHVLVDFRGYGHADYGNWNKNDAKAKVLPYLLALKEKGVNTFIECTPAYLGRDVELLRVLSEESGLQIITNTGYYAAVDYKYLPDHAYTETADQLAERWIHEFESGIENTGIKPGFIKISVNPLDTLPDVDEKIVRAACRTHKETGMTIASHTGSYKTAIAQLAILAEEGIHPSAFIWVHAQMETNFNTYEELANKGVWISLDGVVWDVNGHLQRLLFAKEKGILDHILISHDAGYYSPDPQDEVDFKPYTAIFDELIPELKNEGFTLEELDLLLVKNPARAFKISVRDKK